MIRDPIHMSIIISIFSVLFLICSLNKIDLSHANNGEELPISLQKALVEAAKLDKAIAKGHGVTVDQGRRGGFHHLKTAIISIISVNPSLANHALKYALTLAPKNKTEIFNQVSSRFPGFFKHKINTTNLNKKESIQQLRQSINDSSKAIFKDNPNGLTIQARDFNNWPKLPSKGGTDGFSEVDPLESVNRIFFYGNGALDFLIFEPLAKTYRFFLPESLKPYIRHAFNNLGEPMIFVNDILQLKFHNAAVAFSRFTINSTIGLVGFFDVASELGLPAHKSDFGKTLYSYGLEEGIYLVLPFFGPTTARDSLGIGMNLLIDPKSIILNSSNRAILGLSEGIVRREQLIEPVDYLVKYADDPYKAVRAWTWQKRTRELNTP